MHAMFSEETQGDVQKVVKEELFRLNATYRGTWAYEVLVQEAERHRLHRRALARVIRQVEERLKAGQS